MRLAIPRTLAFEFNSMTLLVIGVVGIVLLGVAYFGIRFWLISTRPPNIREIETPSLDRLNRAALEHMSVPDDEDDPEAQALENEEAPEGLKSALPEDQKPA